MTLLILKNKEIESPLDARDLSSITQNLILGAFIPNTDIVEINNAKSFFYASNNLVCTLDGGAPISSRFGDANIRVNGYWKMTDFSADGIEHNKYQMFNTPAEVEIFNSGRISIKINNSDKVDVEEAYRNRGIPKPDYGMLLVVLNFANMNGENRTEKAFLLKYTHNPLFSTTSILNNGISFLGSIDVNNVYRSAPYSSETFFVPQLSARFFYNFYEPEETEEEVYIKRDYKNKKLSDIPKYNQIYWNPPSFNTSKFNDENRPVQKIGSIMLFGNDVTMGITADAIQANILNSALNFTSSVVRDSLLQLSPEDLSRNRIAPIEQQQNSTLNLNQPISMFGMIIPPTTNETDIARHMANGNSRLGNQSSLLFGGANSTNSFEDVLNRNGGIARMSEGVISLPGSQAILDDFQTFIESVEAAVSVGKDSDYIGYVIEKSKLNEEGDFSVVDLIAVPDKNNIVFTDWKIAYGETYRYRIRSVFRFINKYDIPMFADTDIAISRKQATQYIEANNGQLLMNKAYYFDGVYSDPSEIQTIELNRPEPPSNVKLFPNSKNRYIFITWSQKNQNRDVVGFNVYRKLQKQPNQAFVRLNQDIIDIRNNSFFDEDIEPNINYIYAIESVDFHGNFSVLSTQFYVHTLDVLDDFYIKENPQHFFENEGKELGDEVRQSTNDELILCKKNFYINVNPLFKNTDENHTFVIRVSSLDTGMKKEIKINFKTYTNYHRNISYIPSLAQNLVSTSIAPTTVSTNSFTQVQIKNLANMALQNLGILNMNIQKQSEDTLQTSKVSLEDLLKEKNNTQKEEKTELKTENALTRFSFDLKNITKKE